MNTEYPLSNVFSNDKTHPQVVYVTLIAHAIANPIPIGYQVSKMAKVRKELGLTGISGRRLDDDTFARYEQSFLLRFLNHALCNPIFD